MAYMISVYSSMTEEKSVFRVYLNKDKIHAHKDFDRLKDTISDEVYLEDVEVYGEDPEGKE